MACTERGGILLRTMIERSTSKSEPASARQSLRRAALSALAVVSLSAVGVGTAWAQSSGTFTPAGTMAVARGFHTATRLPDGTVLIAGGRVSGHQDYRGTVTASAEVYDPSTGTFSAAGNMTVARTWHTATLLPNGKALIVGGALPPDDRTAELFDPSTRTFTRTGDTVSAQHGASATLLKNGKVLIAGGIEPVCCTQPTPVSTPELYDPSTGTFTSTGRFVGPGDGFYLKDGPNSPAVTMLADGRVLFAAEPFSELYDPTSGTFSETGAMKTTCGPFYGTPNYISGRTATLLAGGDVLVTGGGHEDCGRFAEAERYDPSSGTFTRVAPMTRRRVFHTATPLRDGTVLIAGGDSESGFSLITEATAEIFYSVTGTFAVVGSMQKGREGHTATLLKDGRVLLTGGVFYQDVGIFQGSLDSADLYTPAVPAMAVSVVPVDGAVTEALRPRLTLHAAPPSAAGQDRGAGAGEHGLLAAPAHLVASPSGSGVVLTWIAPPGMSPLRYAISGGNGSRASNLPVVVTSDASTYYAIPALPPGTYHFTVWAIVADALSAPSNEAAVAIGGGISVTVSPGDVRVHVDGASATAAWTPAPGTLYQVEIGDGPGLADVAVVTTSAPSVTYRTNATGHYLRVRAVRGSMVSAPSNEVFVAVPPAGCGGRPARPILLPVSTSDGKTTIGWLPAGEPLADHYRVDGSGPAGAWTITSDGTSTSVTTTLDPGEYTIRVTAINACADSAASNPIMFSRPIQERLR